MSLMAIVSEGEEPGGSDGVQNKHVRSAPTDTVPLRFLYAVAADDMVHAPKSTTAQVDYVGSCMYVLE
jgi:hypothetical protein